MKYDKVVDLFPDMPKWKKKYYKIRAKASTKILWCKVFLIQKLKERENERK